MRRERLQLAVHGLPAILCSSVTRSFSPCSPARSKFRRSGLSGCTSAKWTAFAVRCISETAKRRNGNDITRRFSTIRPVLAEFPSRAAVVDAELIACGDNGLPDFGALLGRAEGVPLALWCFDLLSLDGVRLMALPFEYRKARLADLVAAADSEHIQYSGGFDDQVQLMATIEKLGHEGIVSKRRDSAYRPGRTKDWLKTKTHAWKMANTDRFEMLRGK